MPAQQDLGRGSIWRKWDLHVHSPASALANQFGGDWEKYIEALASLKDVAVLGITDYFSIEGYRRVLEHRSELSNIYLILPNVELRLNILVGKHAQRANYHVLFSDEVSPDDIENHFFGNLHFQRDGSPAGGATEWMINRKNLEHLGNQLLEENKNFNGSPFSIGCMNATVDHDRVQKLLLSKGEIFRGKYLLILADERTSEMSWDGQDHLTRKLLVKGCHAVFTSNNRNIKWYRGGADIAPDKFRTEYGSLKPCFHGSDAHRLDKIGKPDENRFCWIKADTTFEGLKQTLFEPEARVFIGPEPPRLKSDYQIIESVLIDRASTWFASQNIPINKDLVTIVGGKGSGKSALGEMIAFAGGSKLFAKSADAAQTSDSFLRRSTIRSDTNPIPLTGASVELRWSDGRVDVAEIKDNLRHDKEEERVKYLPQKFVESLCAAEHTEDLQREIERIIFLNLPEANRARASDFQELREQSTLGIRQRRKSLDQAIRGFNASIAQHKAKIGQQLVRQKELNQKQTELEALEKQPPLVPDELKEDLDRVEALTRSRQELEAKLASINETINHVAALETHIDLFSESIGEYNEKVRALAASAGLEAQIGSFLVEPPREAKTVLVSRLQELEAQTYAIKVGGENSAGTDTLNSVEKELLDLQKKLAKIEVKRQEHQSYIEQKTKLETSIKTLEREIAEVTEKIVPSLEADLASLQGKYCDALDLLLQERRQLVELYRPLEESLASADSTAKKLGFNSQVSFDKRKAANRLMEMLDQRSTLRDLTDLEKLLGDFFQKLIDSIQVEAEEAKFDRSVVGSAIKELQTGLVTSSDGGKTKSIEEQLRKTHSREEVDNELFNLHWFGVSYSLLYDGKQLQLLSPGERGIVLLLLYLEAEKSDHRPLVIDQPEDNLDNESVYPSLVEYFRKRKHHRQIIIITHNPNLVVNTDSEQVIVPSYDGGRTPRLMYRSGALENTSPGDGNGIREKVCKVLEGGQDAFRRREEKYSLA